MFLNFKVTNNQRHKPVGDYISAPSANFVRQQSSPVCYYGMYGVPYSCTIDDKLWRHNGAMQVFEYTDCLASIAHVPQKFGGVNFGK